MTKYSFIAVLLLFGTALSSIHIVNPGESIQETVLQSINSDTVIIEDGYYTETIVPYGRTLTIGSRYLLDGDTSHIAATVIAPDFARQDTGSCFVFAHAELEGSKIIGLTMEEGTGTTWISNGFLSGGAIFVMGNLSVENCVIQNCSAVYGGGIAFLDTNHVPTSSGIIRNCLVQNCSAEYYGGGLWSNYCTSLVIDSCDFNNNEAPISGGAVYVSFSDATMTHCRIADNVGGNGCVLWSRRGTISDCIFEGNISQNGFASHLHAANEQTTITRCVFRNTVTPYSAIFLYSRNGGQDVPHFFGNVVENNTTTQVTGSVTIINQGGDFAYNIIRNNTNIAGGAIVVQDGSDAHIHHNWIEGNTNTLRDTMGTAIRIFGRAHPTIDSNAIFNNTGISIRCTDEFHPYCWPIYAENNWWGHESGPYHPELNPTGQGDTLMGQDEYYFSPWLTSPPDTTLPESTKDYPNILSTWELASLYPNPFNNEIQIIVAGFAGRDFRIRLYNLLGQEVDQIHSGELTGSRLHYVAPPSLATGVYLLRAFDNKYAQTKKIIFLK